MNKISFTKDDTNIVKGFAIIMLLVHHLFYIPNQLGYIDWNLFSWNGKIFGFWNILAYIGKICVPIFLILSGYGLYKSYKGKILEFYKKRVLKIYETYWFIWLAFVPLGVFGLHITLSSVYGNHIIPKLIVNILGIQLYFGFWGYNPTWWFISLILGLYLLFPFFYKLMQNKYLCWILLIASYFAYFVSDKHIDIILKFCCPFVLGMVIAKYDLFAKAKKICICNDIYIYIYYNNIMCNSFYLNSQR